MTSNRILKHPVLEVPEKKEIQFTFNGKQLKAQEGEVITSALYANNIKTFGHHPKDKSPQGLFCANGQCSQCIVIADGVPVKGCMTIVESGMDIQSCEGLPVLPEVTGKIETIKKTPEKEVEVLIIGAGPSGLSAAKNLGELGVKVLLIDDKDRLGGKLVLQTHKFFGSEEDCYAGTRGFEIGNILSEEVKKHSNVEIWLNTTAVAVFSDKKVGVINTKERLYSLIIPQKLLVTTGARERSLVFPGNTLPGVYGAGAFQTLVNRDLIRSSERIFIVGGGNVGLIAGYHAIQAGIDVIGLVEALPKCGGYKVHEDKLKRFGVPIFTSHTILSANGENKVISVTIAEIDNNFKPIKGTERTFSVDTVLIAVGLEPVDEFYHKAKAYGLDVWSAGDAQEIAEASAAMFSGKIEATKIAQSLNISNLSEIPPDWIQLATVLKSHPQDAPPVLKPEKEEGVFPIFHCYQKIPCNPCTSVCPQGLIETVDGDIISTPFFTAEKDCINCGRCVAVCPGLAVTIVDYRQDKEVPIVSLPFEVGITELKVGDKVYVANEEGEMVGQYEIQKIRTLKKYPGTQLINIQVPKAIAKDVASLLLNEQYEVDRSMEEYYPDKLPDDAIVCRCERITAGKIREWIKKGVKDINQLKAITRVSSGSCGGKTCSALIMRMFKEEGIPLREVTPNTKRPLFVEVPLGELAGKKED